MASINSDLFTFNPSYYSKNDSYVFENDSYETPEFQPPKALNQAAVPGVLAMFDGLRFIPTAVLAVKDAVCF
jgi:hypothetical protein